MRYTQVVLAFTMLSAQFAAIAQPRDPLNPQSNKECNELSQQWQIQIELRRSQLVSNEAVCKSFNYECHQQNKCIGECWPKETACGPIFIIYARQEGPETNLACAIRAASSAEEKCRAKVQLNQEARNEKEAQEKIKKAEERSRLERTELEREARLNTSRKSQASTNNNEFANQRIAETKSKINNQNASLSPSAKTSSNTTENPFRGSSSSLARIEQGVPTEAASAGEKVINVNGVGSESNRSGGVLSNRTKPVVSPSTTAAVSSKRSNALAIGGNLQGEAKGITTNPSSPKASSEVDSVQINSVQRGSSLARPGLEATGRERVGKSASQASTEAVSGNRKSDESASLKANLGIDGGPAERTGMSKSSDTRHSMGGKREISDEEQRQIIQEQNAHITKREAIFEGRVREAERAKATQEDEIRARNLQVEQKQRELATNQSSLREQMNLERRTISAGYDRTREKANELIVAKNESPRSSPPLSGKYRIGSFSSTLRTSVATTSYIAAAALQAVPVSSELKIITGASLLAQRSKRLAERSSHLVEGVNGKASDLQQAFLGVDALLAVQEARGIVTSAARLAGRTIPPIFSLTGSHAISSKLSDKAVSVIQKVFGESISMLTQSIDDFNSGNTRPIDLDTIGDRMTGDFRKSNLGQVLTKLAQPWDKR